MANLTYIASEGDMIDLICYRHYGGDRPGAVEAVFVANYSRGLASYGPKLPRGVEIVLPDLGASETDIKRQTLVKLWD